MGQRRTYPIYRFRHLIRGTLLVFWIFLFTSNHTPPERMITLDVSDKSLHLAAYLVLAYLLAFATSTRHRMSVRRHLALLLIVAAYGVLDEVLQIPVNRTADVVDWAADVAGAAVGLVLFALTQQALPSLWRPGASGSGLDV